MTEIPALESHVTMLGPSRVGKTSLLTALMVDGERYFRGKDVIVEPADTATRKAFQRSDDLLTGELAAGKFSPNSLPGGAAHVQYRLSVKPLDESGVTIVFHDFPGGWLETDGRRAIVEALRNSSVVIVPVDATMLMEAGRLHSRDAHHHLQITHIRQLAGTWAKSRRRQGLDATLVISPVKCESYFADNGGSRDRSQDLMDLVEGTYREVMDAVVSEFAEDPQNHARIKYVPVDTIGPIDLIEATWTAETNGRPAEMTAEYGVRMGNGAKVASRRIKGAEPLLADLVNLTLDLYRDAIQAVRKERSEKKDTKVVEWEDRGIFQIFFDWVTDHDTDKLREIEELDQALRDSEAKLATLNELVQMKPSDSDGRRTRLLAGA